MYHTFNLHCILLWNLIRIIFLKNQSISAGIYNFGFYYIADVTIYFLKFVLILFWNKDEENTINYRQGSMRLDFTLHYESWGSEIGHKGQWNDTPRKNTGLKMNSIGCNMRWALIWVGNYPIVEIEKCWSFLNPYPFRTSIFL